VFVLFYTFFCVWSYLLFFFFFFLLIQVAAQLNAMRDENRRMWDQLTTERRKVEKLVSVVGRLWDVVSKGFPGSG
jgi:hypothetical protein